MIPKIIHYCWLSEEEYPELVKKCIKSWHEKLPEYQFIKWTTENFDVNSNIFCKEAYESKKYAFASDYIRVKVLYDYGGVYLDSDIEVFKKFDDLLDNKAFIGFENDKVVTAWCMACEKYNPVFKKFLDYYEERHFIMQNGNFDMLPNPQILTPILVNEEKLILNSEYQQLKNITIYPKDYFCPKDYKTGKINITDNSYCIHYFNGDWLSKTTRLKSYILKFLRKYLGYQTTSKLLNFYRKVRRLD